MSNIPPGAGALLGQRLGNFEIVALLALGGTAEIYLAKVAGDSGFEKHVVVKCLHDYLADDEEFVKMFLDEARLAANLNHSNIAQTLGLGEHENRYYIVMEYLVGMSLAMVARRGGERMPGGILPIPTTLNLIHQACGGLHYAHEFSQNGAAMQIVHRDISPQNLVVTFEGIIKLVDFGIAKAEQRETQTKSGTIKGKFAYMSPEQCIAQGVDRRTDVFALGIIMHELLTGKRLFKRPNPYDTYQAVIDCKVLAPSKLNHELDPVLDTIVLRALSKNKEDRYPTAEAMGDEILSYIHQQGSSGGQGEVGRFFEQHFATEIEEHYDRMRELIAGDHAAPMSVEGAWDAPAAGASAGSRAESRAEPVEPAPSATPTPMPVAPVAQPAVPATPIKPILPTMMPATLKAQGLGVVPSIVPKAVQAAVPFDAKKTQFGIGKPSVKVPTAIPAIVKQIPLANQHPTPAVSGVVPATAPAVEPPSAADSATLLAATPKSAARAVTANGTAVEPATAATPSPVAAPTPVAIAPARAATPAPVATRAATPAPIATGAATPAPVATPAAVTPARAATAAPLPASAGPIHESAPVEVVPPAPTTAREFIAPVGDAFYATSPPDAIGAELSADDSVIEESSVRSEVSEISRFTAGRQPQTLPSPADHTDGLESDFQGEATQIEASPHARFEKRTLDDEQTKDHDEDYSQRPVAAAHAPNIASAPTIPVDSFVAVAPHMDQNVDARPANPSAEYPVVPSRYPGYQPIDQYGNAPPQPQPFQPQNPQHPQHPFQQNHHQQPTFQQPHWGHEGTTPTPISAIGRPLSGSFQAVGYPLNSTPLAASPVGDKYAKQVDWNAAAAQRARAVPAWLLAVLFLVSLLAALTLTVLIRKLL